MKTKTAPKRSKVSRGGAVAGHFSALPPSAPTQDLNEVVWRNREHNRETDRLRDNFIRIGRELIEWGDDPSTTDASIQEYIRSAEGQPASPGEEYLIEMLKRILRSRRRRRLTHQQTGRNVRQRVGRASSFGGEW